MADNFGPAIPYPVPSGKSFDDSYSSPLPGAGPGRADGGHLFRLVINDAELQRLMNRLGPGAKQRATNKLIGHNARMAREFAELVGDIHLRERKRPRTSDRILYKTLISARNRRHTATGWSVGDVAYMDQSYAKYWRVIERGTTYFVGRRIRGVWRSGPRGGTYSGMGVGEDRQDRFLPFATRQKAASWMLGKGGHGAKQSVRVRATVRNFEGIIRRPIVAHHMFRDAWTQYDAVGRAAEAVQQVIADLARD